MAYADAFAVAMATAHGAILVTGDPEILEAGTGCQLEVLR
jgi:predicted nucleic acid-binding protein